MSDQTKAKPFGFFITYRHYKEGTKTCGRVASSEAAARSAMRKLYSCREIYSLEPLDEAAYKRTFGWGRM